MREIRTVTGLVKIERSDADVVHSEFPHPLVTLDYGADGNLVAIVVAGNDLKVEVEES